MHRWLLVIGPFSLAACGPVEPLDCGRVVQELDWCIDRQLAEDCWRKYVPLSKSKRYHGTWANTFEYNHFWNGEVISPERAFEYRYDATELYVEGSELEEYWTTERSRVMEVDFVGRKFLCNLTEPVTYILVDKVTAAHVIEDRPSGWY